VAEAQAKLESAQAAYAVAKAESDKKAEELRLANVVLVQAKAEEAKGQEKVDAQREAVAGYARAVYQDNLPMISVVTLLGASSSSDLANRVQWTDTVLVTNQIDLDYLREIQAELAEKRLQSQIAQETATAAKEEADRHTAVMEEAMKAAERAHAEVEAALAEQVAARAAAQSALKADQASLASHEAELRKVNEEIAELARKAAASKPASGSSSSSSSSSGYKVSSYGLIWPSTGWVSSNYGYRIHPIAKVRRFHDGIDVAASCGTPLKAVAAGRVSQRYYSSGYGYRIFIDHGWVKGRHIVSSYNHLSRYAVSNGARVSQGQTIGYVGTTGYSTGCHLHFMLWVGGSLVNPRNYLP
jgi:murein DD-endopeptidase MepM/ murein hydrolase activator NlpD